MDAWDELSPVYRRSVETAALVTSVSRYTRRRLFEWVGIDPVRVKILPNTVDPRFQSGTKARRTCSSVMGSHGKKVLMTVSRLASSEQYKGHDRVIRMLPRVLVNHPETIYLIVGDGDDRPRLEVACRRIAEWRKASGSRVGCTPEELPDYFRLADVFVMPSTGEGFGIVFLEAMATGIHVIGGNQDGSPDALCRGGLAKAIDPEDQDELALCNLRRAQQSGSVSRRRPHIQASPFR